MLRPARLKSCSRLLAATDWAKRTYRIDPARTLLTGYSMGAMGTWYLAARHQDIFRAAIPWVRRAWQ